MAKRNYQVEVLIAILELYDSLGRPVSGDEVATQIEGEADRVTIAIRSLVGQGKVHVGAGGLVYLTRCGDENAKEWLAQRMPETVEPVPRGYRAKKNYIKALRGLAYSGNALAKERAEEASEQIARTEKNLKWIAGFVMLVIGTVFAIIAAL
ncbi:MAG: hypothetical protein KAU31_11875 [Spirochaetaceae bacterium]|nr:hypothetical protein [Spirochaetaceae bacterium]